MKTVILPILAALSLAIAPAASASEEFDFEFEYSPIEVSTEFGAKQVYDELVAEIEDECIPNIRRIDQIMHQDEIRACIDDTLNAAVAQIDQPEVTKIHKAKQG